MQIRQTEKWGKPAQQTTPYSWFLTCFLWHFYRETTIKHCVFQHTNSPKPIFYSLLYLNWLSLSSRTHFLKKRSWIHRDCREEIVLFLVSSTTFTAHPSEVLHVKTSTKLGGFDDVLQTWGFANGGFEWQNLVQNPKIFTGFVRQILKVKATFWQNNPVQNFDKTSKY